MNKELTQSYLATLFDYKDGNLYWKIKKNWMAQLVIDGKNTYLGSFDDLELAELVVVEARNKYHGLYARNI